MASLRLQSVLALEIPRRGNREQWRPKVDRELRDLIRRMRAERIPPLWGAPRIHGELLMLLGVRSRPVDGLQIHGAGSEAAFAILEDVSSKPHGGDRCY